ncbi:MAG: AAA family ATPase [Chlamydiae bacterium]|nr:AAA family ATPase [Chlamydiota bacterium]MBI3277608.1 AAA family ATPase [Chlamydiota bacterium]
MEEKENTEKTHSFEEFQKEFSKLLKERLGTKGLGFVFPQPEAAKTQEEVPQEKKAPVEIKFDLKPKEVKAYLDRFVIQQDEAKKVLAIAVCDHYHHVASCLGKSTCGAYAKQNVLLMGPTGVGKTYLVKTIAQLIGVPFIKADATKFSETGYVGGDVEDLVRDLVHKADGNLELAQYGIVYLDEVDKIAAPSNLIGRDVSGQGVQRGLLKLMEETEVSLKSSTDLTSQLQAVMEFQSKGKIERKMLGTRHILFIVSGAFDGLSEIVKKRLEIRSIGFSDQGKPPLFEGEFQKHAKTHDFIKFGFDPEFIARLPVRVVLEDLLEEDLYQILKRSEDSVIKQYVSDFKSYGIEAIFSDEALRAVARKASQEKTGARGLFTICEKALRNYKYELPSTSIRRFVITPVVIDHPQEELQRMIQDPSYIDHEFIVLQIQAFEKDFEEKNGIKIRFDEGAQNRIAEIFRAPETSPEGNSLSVAQLCRDRLKNYEYGLALIRQNSGRDLFQITGEVLNQSQLILDQWIRDSYDVRKRKNKKQL